ncbi:hypothetical protein [Nocardioides speluncae]|uniref:hypothetical protein n=1 Tax=Nocardioides speluncae TaxID=2670337 RepID=UPI000D695CDC|nr:hypothetical protein [Nocardioides speluncae]
MSNIKHTMKVEFSTPSGMPTYGTAMYTSAWATFGATCAIDGLATQGGVDVRVRDRFVPALVKGATPGISAWSPPIC